jgi:S-DNA-T family DNA segregation ATPase FtsK/SpoIIIE
MHDLLGLALFGLGAASLVWLAWPQQAPIPSGIERLLRLIAGAGSWAVPLTILYLGVLFLLGAARATFNQATAGCVVLFLTFVTWRHVADPIPETIVDWSDPAWSQHVMRVGGAVGALFGTILLKTLGTITSHILLTCCALGGLVLVADRPLLDLVRIVKRNRSAAAPAAGRAVVRQRGIADDAPTVRGVRAKERSAETDAVAQRRGTILGLLKRRTVDTETPPLPGMEEYAAAAAEAETADAKAKPRRVTGLDAPKKTSDEELVLTANDSVNPNYKLPPADLLKHAPPPVDQKVRRQEAADKIKVLEQTLEQFGIQANVVEIAHGPTVTRYEIQLAPGVKVSKIVSLADNLAMALAAIDVRVEAPIPGKSAIGVEVPNRQPSMVSMRETIESPEFQRAPGKLTFCLGRDVGGEIKVADLSRMPHLLIGGSTNSGKSVCLNVLIASMVYRATPREVKFLMIDPKRVELSLWDGIPHLMHPVVKDVKQSAGIFRAALKEMDRRYDLFSRLGTRNLEGYNQKVDEEERLPFIVIVVDELADLMMQMAAEIETSICRLAQLARATGIHMVIATQRPSVDVITGLIKSNIPSRVAFAVSSQVDSRTILDSAGADRLIGRGDMLFLPIDANKPVRIQGCYLSESETNDLVAYLKAQEKPNYTLQVADASTVNSALSGDAEQFDDLFEPAVKLIVANGSCSTSMIQRRFKIGYTRAARLVDMMHERGIVGSLDGAKPREILMSREEVDRMFLGSDTMDDVI